MNRFFITVLRAGIVAAFLAGLYGQIVVVPQTAADEVEQFPPYAPFEAPYVTVAIAGIACVQVALIATWTLLTMVQRDAIFTARAFRWVDTVIGCSIVTTLLALGVATHLALADIPTRNDDMDVIGALGAAIVSVGVGASFAMLIAIMRGLLHKATNLQTEIAEVV